IKNHLNCLNVDDRFSPNDVRRLKLGEIENYTLQNKEVPFKEQPKERDGQPKERDEELKEINYAVGMIVRHNHNQDQNNNKTGVIIGWDGRFELKSQLAQYRRHESYMPLSIYEHPDHLRTSCLPDSRVEKDEEREMLKEKDEEREMLKEKDEEDALDALHGD
ncbi:hypothetical protein RF55_15876, partial [Lasius niger]